MLVECKRCGYTHEELPLDTAENSQDGKVDQYVKDEVQTIERENKSGQLGVDK